MLAAWGHMGRNDDPMIMNEVDRFFQQFGQPSGQQVLDLAKTLANEKRVVELERVVAFLGMLLRTLSLPMREMRGGK